MENRSKEELIKKGVTVLKSFIDKKYCLNLKDMITNSRKKSGNKFYSSEKEFKKYSRFTKCNPDLKFNYLNHFEHKYLDQKILSAVPGKIISKKIVWNVNKKFLPKWLRKYEKYLIGNINPYIKKKFQDETHFYGVYIHPDILTGHKETFITAYLYLDRVKKENSPIYVFEKSHQLGLSKFPVYIKKFNKDYLYINEDKTMFTKKKTITGNSGDLILFDGRCLHSTDYNISTSQRVSIRYLVQPHNKLKEFNGRMKHFTFGLKGDHMQLVGMFNK